MSVKDKHHMISPLNGTQATKQTRKQNRTRGIEIQNIGTVARGEVAGDNGAKVEGFC